jgi:hypothetical protein
MHAVAGKQRDRGRLGMTETGPGRPVLVGKVRQAEEGRRRQRQIGREDEVGRQG